MSGDLGRRDVGEPRALLQATLAYLLWGLFPLYFILLERSGAFEIVAHRALWSLLVCMILLVIMRRFREFLAVVRSPRLMGTFAIAALLLSTNWTVYVWGVTNGRALDAALGYYINPLVSATLGIIFLGEKLRRAQLVAFAFGAAAAVVLVVAYGEFPWIALTLAISWGIYGLVKHNVGSRVSALPGFTAETLALTPIAASYLAFLAVTGTATVDPISSYGALVATSGIITTVPLLLFAAAAPRATLTAIGMLQYIAPTMIFIMGITFLGEAMPPARWAGFILVWVAILIFAVDTVRATNTPGTAPILRRRPRRDLAD